MINITKELETEPLNTNPNEDIKLTVNNKQINDNKRKPDIINQIKPSDIRLSVSSSEKIENLNINEEIRKSFTHQSQTNIINNEENQKKKSEIMNSIQSMSSIDSEEYVSAQSCLMTKTMLTESLNMSNELTDSMYSKGEPSSDGSDNEEESEINEMYDKIKKLIANGDFNQVKEIEARITQLEIEVRKQKHNEKLKKLSELEENMKNSKGDYIKEENIGNNAQLVLANINPDDGYAIIPKSELDKAYEIKNFKDYEFYIKRTRILHYNSNLSSL